jgi:ubiquinone/menaquinone biosynthesis C-methylase UbiE
MASQLDERPETQEETAPALSPEQIYERFSVPALFAPAAERLLEVAGPQPGERVLDVGTGTGIVARLAAPRVLPDGSVTALDLSPAMLAIARSAAEEEGLAIAWHEGRAEKPPFPDAQFDLVLSQFAAMFFTDLPAALAEMRRVLAPGGRLSLSVFQAIERHPFYMALDRAIQRQLGVPAIADIFALGDAEDLKGTLARAGFRDVAVTPFELALRVPDPDAFLAGEIALDSASIPAMQGLDATARQNLTAAIQDEMAAPLRAVTDGDYVRLTFYAQIAHGRS